MAPILFQWVELWEVDLQSMQCSSFAIQQWIMIHGRNLEIVAGDGKAFCPTSRRCVGRISQKQDPIADGSESEIFTPPDAEFAKKYNITWDASVHVLKGPIQANYSPYDYRSSGNYQKHIFPLISADSQLSKFLVCCLGCWNNCPSGS